MKRVFISFLIAVVICAFLFSCHDKKDSLTIDYKDTYYPLDTGKYLVYDVDSISCYNTNFIIDTVHYQYKEMVTDTFYDNQNRLNYELSYYRRADANSPWVFDRKWSAFKTLNNVQKNEGDLRFIKLVFPPQPAFTWDGNLYIAKIPPYDIFENWNYQYITVDAPYSINAYNFDSAAVVVDVADSNFVSKHWRKEVYAKHIGKVYEEYEMKTKQYADNWYTGRWNGFAIQMRLTDHN